MSKKNKKAVSDKTKKALDIIVDNLVWIAGCVIYALAINFFNVPNQIAQGGFSGLAIVINYLTDLPVGTINLALNIPLLLIALKFIGKKFVLKKIDFWLCFCIDIDCFFFHKSDRPSFVYRYILFYHSL